MKNEKENERARERERESVVDRMIANFTNALWMQKFYGLYNNQKPVIKLRIFGLWFCVWCDGMLKLPAVVFYFAFLGAEGKCPLVGFACYVRARYDNVDVDDDVNLSSKTS